jgi:hypothetical protein
MSMPGFTAEVSFYRSCARYRGKPASELRKGDEGMIHPALGGFYYFCQSSGNYNYKMCCFVWDGGHYCMWGRDLPG